MENSASLIDAFAQVAGPLTELQDEFPLLTQALSALTTVVGGAGVGGAGGGILSGVATGGTAAAGTAAAGAVGAGSLAASGGVAVGGAALGLGIGRGITSAIDLARGNSQATDASDQFFGSLFSTDRSVLADVWSGIGSLREGVAGDANNPQTRPSERAAEAGNRAMTDLAGALRENTAATRENSRSPDGGADPVLP